MVTWPTAEGPGHSRPIAAAEEGFTLIELMAAIVVLVIGITGVAQVFNGTLRADYNGQPITVSDPTSTAFFNTAAFSVPAAGTFDIFDAGIVVG